jgi:glycogen operon protein
VTTPARAPIDGYPTHEFQGFRFRRGATLPFGATLQPHGVNFSIFSSAATACTLVLFRRGEKRPMAEIPFPDEFRTGDVYSMLVFGLDYEEIEYGFRFAGPWEPDKGNRFDVTNILSDPYAHTVAGRDVWRKPPDFSDPYQHRARLTYDDFDWEEDRQLEHPIQDLVVYEMHVRGFTAHPSAKASAPGTYVGLLEKIPYLQELGVTCVELLPVFEFNEWENHRRSPDGKDTLLNYWGYSTLGFFAPKAGYAATGALGMQADEFKNLVKQLHRAGIEVILDVVFNHTAEGDHRGPTISFRGIDNRTYYMLTPDGHYFNFSGTGNTLNCNHPVVRNLVLDCLRYWVSHFHVDGFRFDLASILGRDQNGAPLANPPLLESLAFDPVLSKCKLIAEAWDAGGLYQVGCFPAYGRWAEWNGKFRDDVRRFVKGDAGMVPAIAQRIMGSPDLYAGRGPCASVNFITCHDGFTLRDLFSYDDKHNDANGEDNRDGADDNNSWNCGVEGPTDNAGINRLRLQLSKNALALLLLSRGVPMLLMGDEAGRTQRGNNNAYCQDNDLSWFDWSLRQSNAELFRFTQLLLAFRRKHPMLRSNTFPKLVDMVGSGHPDLGFHGTEPEHPDLSPTSRTLAFRLCGQHAPKPDDDIYVAMNMYWDALPFGLPAPGDGKQWRVAVNTSMPAGQDIFDERLPELADQKQITVGARSLVVLIAADE